MNEIKKTSTDESKKAPFIWECSKCGEHHEYQFSYCPSCGEMVTSLKVVKRTGLGMRGTE